MSLADLIPTSFAVCGALFLGLAIVLILVDPPGKAPWSRISGVFAFIGGAGAVGGAGGWVGQHILSASSTVTSWTQQWASAIGGGATVCVLLLGGLWAFSHIGKGGSGTAAGGSGKVGKRVRALFKGGLIALIGAAIFTAIPPLYDGADWVVAHVGTATQNVIS